MDTKKVLQQLIKIADNQQKIINKLAQQQAIPAMEPQHLDPNKTQHEPAKALLNALPPAVKQTVTNLEARNDDMLVSFQQGKATQGNYDAVLKTLQNLTNQNVIQHAYNLKIV